MSFDPAAILAVLDRCCERSYFPMLNNAYVYPAAARLSLFRSPADWAMVIEVFGFSPRAGLPDTSIQTFASRLHNRDGPDQYVNRAAHERYLANNPNNEYRSAWPIAEGPWQDPDDLMLVAEGARGIELRGRGVPLPPLKEYARHGITLAKAPRVQIFELCRYLAEVARDQVLADPQERRVSVLPEMIQIMQLEEWHHPDLADDEYPSQVQTFRQLARVLATGDVREYRPSRKPNTHWSNWPDGGML